MIQWHINPFCREYVESFSCVCRMTLKKNTKTKQKKQTVTCLVPEGSQEQTGRVSRCRNLCAAKVALYHCVKTSDKHKFLCVYPALLCASFL